MAAGVVPVVRTQDAAGGSKRLDGRPIPKGGDGASIHRGIAGATDDPEVKLRVVAASRTRHKPQAEHDHQPEPGTASGRMVRLRGKPNG